VNAPARSARGIPLVPRLILGAFALLALSWLGFMLHYVLIGSKHQPRPEPAVRVMPTNRVARPHSP